MRRFVITVAAATVFLAGAPIMDASVSAAPMVAPRAIRAAADSLNLVERAQFIWLGHHYCWYDDGWNGSGFYWCGYAKRHGLGWGGGAGWHGWQQGGKPEGGKPEGRKLEGRKSEDRKSEGGQPQGGQPQGGKSQGGQPQGGQPQGGKPEGGQPQGGQPKGGEPQGGQNK
jgi:hypothetical protein